MQKGVSWDQRGNINYCCASTPVVVDLLQWVRYSDGSREKLDLDNMVTLLNAVFGVPSRKDFVPPRPSWVNAYAVFSLSWAQALSEPPNVCCFSSVWHSFNVGLYCQCGLSAKKPVKARAYCIYTWIYSSQAVVLACRVMLKKCEMMRRHVQTDKGWMTDTWSKNAITVVAVTSVPNHHHEESTISTN